MSLPSSIPGYDTVEFPDFDQLDSTIPPPAEVRLRAWAKFAETERRMTIFDWATWALTKALLLRFMNDLASAYLLSFEATLELLKDKRGDSREKFETWLVTNPAYDLECRGIRTLRHLEAHVRPRTISRLPGVLEDSRFAGPRPGGRVAWCWDPISFADFDALRAPALGIDQLDAWNSRCASLHVRGLMLHGLEHLRDILAAAEGEQAA